MNLNDDLEEIEALLEKIFGVSERMPVRVQVPVEVHLAILKYDD